jgi:hypothetical protein
MTTIVKVASYPGGGGKWRFLEPGETLFAAYFKRLRPGKNLRGDIIRQIVNDDMKDEVDWMKALPDLDVTPKGQQGALYDRMREANKMFHAHYDELRLEGTPFYGVADIEKVAPQAIWQGWPDRDISRIYGDIARHSGVPYVRLTRILHDLRRPFWQAIRKAQEAGQAKASFPLQGVVFTYEAHERGLEALVEPISRARFKFGEPDE